MQFHEFTCKTRQSRYPRSYSMFVLEVDPAVTRYRTIMKRYKLKTFQLKQLAKYTFFGSFFSLVFYNRLCLLRFYKQSLSELN